MQALKALVIFMGILIAVGVAVLGVTIYNRATKMVTSDKSAPAASSLPPLAGATPGSPLAPPSQGSPTSGSTQGSTGPAPSFGVRDLGLPPGSIVVSVQPLETRVLVQARLPDGGTRILLLDPASGAIAGEWRAPGAAGMQAPTSPTPPPSSDGSGTQPLPSEGSGRP
jgi:hypothetical protein